MDLSGNLAVVDFMCPHCYAPRKLYFTPPHPRVKLPLVYMHQCPDCGGGIKYNINYDGRGRLSVTISAG